MRLYSTVLALLAVFFGVYAQAERRCVDYHRCGSSPQCWYVSHWVGADGGKFKSEMDVTDPIVYTVVCGGLDSQPDVYVELPDGGTGDKIPPPPPPKPLPPTECFYADDGGDAGCHDYVEPDQLIIRDTGSGALWQFNMPRNGAW